jgi:predicted glycoside hydrolase/deacetylase ChbG (UPF0249 family)
MMVWLHPTPPADFGAQVRTPAGDQRLREHPNIRNDAVTPLLIVNADDFGIDAGTTDAILDCYSTRGISSTSAMVWMADSRRASKLANEVGIPVGLHLNLTQSLGDPSVPTAIRVRQAALAGYFRSLGRWAFNPALQRRVERAIGDQLDQFHALYGRAPTHIDGHHHIQVSPNVLAARTLPQGTKVRRGFTYFHGDKSLPNRIVRRGLNAVLARRFKSPQYFFCIRTLHPELGGTGMGWKLALAHRVPVEVMCHPGRDDERKIVTSDHWGASIASFPTGSYSEL